MAVSMVVASHLSPSPLPGGPNAYARTVAPYPRQRLLAASLRLRQKGS
jgi:hypothetical protein